MFTHHDIQISISVEIADIKAHGADVYAIFDRAIRKLDAPDSGVLPDHPDLADVLAKHSINLVLRP